MSPSDMGCGRLRREMLNLNLAFIDKSSYSLLLKSYTRPNCSRTRAIFRSQIIKSCGTKEKLKQLLGGLSPSMDQHDIRAINKINCGYKLKAKSFRVHF